MNGSKWRKHANCIIHKVAQDNPGLSESELRKKISASYPFGERERHPYKIWLSAVKLHFEGPPPRNMRTHVEPVHEDQTSLF